MPTSCSFKSLCTSSIATKLLEPYREASKHFTIAKDGKVDNAAQRIFSKDQSSTTLSLKERVLHVLTGLALALPIVNHITYFVLSKLDCLLNKAASSEAEPQGRVRFADAARARPFDRNAAPAAVRLQHSIELPLRRSAGAAS